MGRNEKQLASAKQRRQQQLLHSTAVSAVRCLSKGVHGGKLSLDEQGGKINDAALTYGDVVPESFIQILKYVCSHRKSLDGRGTFVDLGSGTGRAVVLAALSGFGFSHCIGIEMLKSLHDSSCVAKEQLHTAIQQVISSSTCASTTRLPPTTKSTLKCVIDKDGMLAIIRRIMNSECIKEVEIADGAADGTLVEKLANSCCKEVGHKSFKLFVKEHKSFLKFLQSHGDIFEFSSDHKFISLCSPKDTHTTCVDCSSSGTMDPVSMVNVDDCSFPITTEGTTSEVSDTGNNNILDQHADTAGNRSSSASSWSNDLTDLLGHLPVSTLSTLPLITFEQNDIFLTDWWRTADVVYAANLLFPEEVLRRLSVDVLKMRPGSWFISLRPLTTTSCTFHDNTTKGSGGMGAVVTKQAILKSESFYKMSWEMACVYMYEIISNTVPYVEEVGCSD